MSTMKQSPASVNALNPSPLYAGRIWCNRCGCTGAFLFRDPDADVAELVCPDCTGFEIADATYEFGSQDKNTPPTVPPSVRRPIGTPR